MSGSVNKVILVGNVGKDPVIRAGTNGGKFASFSLATSEVWKDKASGERKEKTEWHNVSVFNERLVEVVEKYVLKGSRIYIEGALSTRKWTDKSGVEKYTTEVVISKFKGEIVLLGGKGEASSQPSIAFFDEPGGTPLPSNFDELNDEVPF